MSSHPQSLESAMSIFVRDPALRAVLAATKARHDALPPREQPLSGTPTLCWPDAHRAPPRRDYSGPLPVAFEHDDRAADWDFWQGHVRAVPMLSKLTCQQMMRERIRQKHWRQAVAVVIGKWDGQVRVDRVAMVIKIARDLERSPGKDPREHPAYRVVMDCRRAAIFAGVEAFLRPNT